MGSLTTLSSLSASIGLSRENTKTGYISSRRPHLVELAALGFLKRAQLLWSAYKFGFFSPSILRHSMHSLQAGIYGVVRCFSTDAEDADSFS